MIINQQEQNDLLLLARNGNLSAFDKLFFAYEKAVYNYILKLVRQEQDAEDLTQKTFIKIYKSRSSINPEKSFKSWVYKIATNTVYDWFRQKNRQKEFLLENLSNYTETIEDENAYYNYNVENFDSLEVAMNKIKPIHKSVLLLFYKEEQTYNEIAEILDLPLNTVKTHLSRAKQALKNELLKQNGNFADFK